MALKVMGVHGLGDHRNSGWADAWRDAIAGVGPIRDAGGAAAVEFVPFSYDDVFERAHISWQEASRAVAKLIGSGLASGGDALRGRARGIAAVNVAPPHAGIGEPPGGWRRARHRLRWSAGYVVAWVEDDGFRRQTRARLRAALSAERPDVLLAHSLGSLISYDALATRDDRPAGDGFTFVTLGSQLGNPFVRRNLAPRGLRPLDVRRWVHLYNPEDQVFTAPIRFAEPVSPGRFRQVLTHFDLPGFADHSAVHYLAHPATAEAVWRPLVGGAWQAERAVCAWQEGARAVTGLERFSVA